jgi:hypothetical protein
MTNTPFEYGHASIDQVTSGRLREARLIVARLLELDADSVQGPMELAQVLQGVSRALSDIVLARGAVETWVTRAADPDDPKSLPSYAAEYVVRRYSNPENRNGEMFVGKTHRQQGAYLAMYLRDSQSQQVKQSVRIPTDHQIDSFFMNDLRTWRDLTHHSEDYSSGNLNTAYPFHIEYGSDDAPHRYLAITQLLSEELVELTIN